MRVLPLILILTLLGTIAVGVSMRSRSINQIRPSSELRMVGADDKQSSDSADLIAEEPAQTVIEISLTPVPSVTSPTDTPTLVTTPTDTPTLIPTVVLSSESTCKGTNMLTNITRVFPNIPVTVGSCDIYFDNKLKSVWAMYGPGSTTLDISSWVAFGTTHTVQLRRCNGDLTSNSISLTVLNTCTVPSTEPATLTPIPPTNTPVPTIDLTAKPSSISNTPIPAPDDRGATSCDPISPTNLQLDMAGNKLEWTGNGGCNGGVVTYGVRIDQLSSSINGFDYQMSGGCRDFGGQPWNSSAGTSGDVCYTQVAAEVVSQYQFDPTQRYDIWVNATCAVTPPGCKKYSESINVKFNPN